MSFDLLYIFPAKKHTHLVRGHNTMYEEIEHVWALYWKTLEGHLKPYQHWHYLKESKLNKYEWYQK